LAFYCFKIIVAYLVIGFFKLVSHVLLFEILLLHTTGIKEHDDEGRLIVAEYDNHYIATTCK